MGTNKLSSIQRTQIVLQEVTIFSEMWSTILSSETPILFVIKSANCKALQTNNSDNKG